MSPPNTTNNTSNILNLLEGIIGADKYTAYRIALTPEMARTFLTMMPKNRPLRALHVDKLVREMKRGEWAFTGKGVAFNSKGQMVDGQHTCHAVIKSNVDVPILVVVGVDDDAYRKMDSGARRNSADYLSAEVTHRYAVAGACSILYAEERMKSGSSPFGVAELHRMPSAASEDIVARYPALLSAKPKLFSPIGIPPRIGVYSWFRCHIHDADACDRFWDGTFSGAALEVSDPRFHLRKRLLEQRRSSKMRDEHIAAYIIKAWTAFSSGAPMFILKWAEGESFPRWPGVALGGITK